LKYKKLRVFNLIKNIFNEIVLIEEITKSLLFNEKVLNSRALFEINIKNVANLGSLIHQKHSFLIIILKSVLLNESFSK